MRRTALAAIVAAGLLVAACGDDDDESSSSESSATQPAADTTAASGTAAAPDTTAAAGGSGDAAACVEGKPLVSDGTLTIGTGSPAFPPYVVDDEPENKQGFEAAVGWAVAAELGFDDASVTWVRTTFDEAIQPGVKNFDVNLQQFSITPERAENITFSEPYYTSNQAIVGLDGSAAEGATTIADLQDVKFGAQAGTTSLQFITDVIQPDAEPFVYDDNVGAKAALEANQIDAIVVDLPTAFYISAVEIEGSSVIGQFPAEAGGTTDEFGMVLEQDNPLVECVNLALANLRESGELEEITATWMSAEAGAPVIAVE
jgi:polar amino acid transport system substrate-binding protein